MLIDDKDDKDPLDDKKLADDKSAAQVADDKDKDDDDLDYEIVEEDKPVSKSNDDGDTDDEDGDGESDQSGRLTNAEKRRKRKKRLKEKLDQKDSMIRMQDQQIRMLHDRLSVVERKSTGHDRAQLDHAISETETLVQRASELHAEAVSEKDVASASAAMQELLKAQNRLDHLKGIKERVSKPVTTQQQPLDPVVVRHTNNWMQRNTWFNPDSNDIDSKLTRMLDDSVMEDGFDPRTEEYWKELDKRITKHIPHRKVGKNNDEDEEDDDDEIDDDKKSLPKKPHKSVISGGNEGSPGRKVKITLSKERVQAIKDAGYWDDPVERKKMVKQYIEYDRAQGKGN